MGCTRVSHIYLTNGLASGSRRSDVIFTMGGEPAEKRASGKTDVMVYYLHAALFDLIFNQKRAPYVGFYPLLRTGREFWVVLSKNSERVIAFGYAEDFGNSLKNLDALQK
ncbi:MAG: hypothetical protein LBI70_01840 [Rickettsiales bacterium]|jgi:hypothetical protein|nr:hypothetical protein [Rickettsiales bacterium]